MSGSVRIGAAWTVLLLLLVLAHPTGTLFRIGVAVATAGLLLRAWAAGSIDKGAALATGGPYAYTRNPLYLGSFLIGIGVGLAGGHWAWPLLIAVAFLVVYIPTIRREADELLARFGDGYREYADQVPALSLRVRPYHAQTEEVSGVEVPQGFLWRRYARYREWEAALGAGAVFGVLALRMYFGAR